MNKTVSPMAETTLALGLAIAGKIDDSYTKFTRIIEGHYRYNDGGKYHLDYLRMARKSHDTAVEASNFVNGEAQARVSGLLVIETSEFLLSATLLELERHRLEQRQSKSLLSIFMREESSITENKERLVRSAYASQEAALIRMIYKIAQGARDANYHETPVFLEALRTAELEESHEFM
ncbi:MAG: hypothetical protein ABR981_00185 [Candidatus Micrarchaeaceae archaeon]|jgi:hypothetical protein